MARLTKRELNLLMYPPTETTWVCKKKKEEGTCSMVNNGKNKECWVCLTPRPSKPTLLWPTYLAVCKKAGVEPGTRSLGIPKQEDQSDSTKRRRRTKRAS